METVEPAIFQLMKGRPGRAFIRRIENAVHIFGKCIPLGLSNTQTRVAFGLLLATLDLRSRNIRCNVDSNPASPSMIAQLDRLSIQTALLQAQISPDVMEFRMIRL